MHQSCETIYKKVNKINNTARDNFSHYLIGINFREDKFSRGFIFAKIRMKSRK